MTSIRVRVLFFARHREELGSGEREFDLPLGSTVSELLDRIRAIESGPSLPQRPAVAVNREYASLDSRLNAGDEVAVIPNVAGG